MNPWLLGSTGMGMFGGSGFEAADPYSLWNKGPLPRQPTYPSVAYNALGKKIWQAPPPPAPGVTLNSSPAAPPAPTLQTMAQNNPQLGQLMGWQALSAPEQFMGGNVTGNPATNLAIGGTLAGGAAPGTWPSIMQQQAAGAMGGGPGGPGGAASAAPAPPPPQTNQGYLAALANPGHVDTPGAAIPQAGSTINNMLNRWGGTPGINLNTNFVNALRSLYPTG